MGVRGIGKACLVGYDGRVWCSAGGCYHCRGVKRSYETIEEAWLDAVVQGADHGCVMTPYRCAPIARRVSYEIVRLHPNPWAFRPWWRKVVTRNLRRRTCCGGFHLTTKAIGYMLTSGSE
jgi:hypothetical protein